MAKIQFPLSWTGCLANSKEPSLPYYLSIARERRDGFMHFPKALAQSEIQTASTRIWTQVTDSISYDDNHYAKHTSYNMRYVIS